MIIMLMFELNLNTEMIIEVTQQEYSTYLIFVIIIIILFTKDTVLSA